MNNLPLVSIAIITYNQKDYLDECIQSCLKQTYSNYQIIVADDCSSDGTQKMLKEYLKLYPDIFILKLAEKNLGITHNSNAAHFACNGKYVAWMGGDDLMFPDKIDKQVQYMESKPDCTICYHNLDVFDSDTNKTINLFNDKNKINGDIRDSIRLGTFNGACSNLVRREKAPKEGFNTTLPVASDWLYWIDTLANGGTIDYIDEVLGRYRRHSNNITNKSQSITQNEVDHLNTCQIVLSKYPKYYDEVMIRYSLILASLRHKLPYLSTLKSSYLLKPRFKTAIPLILHLVTFGKVKL